LSEVALVAFRENVLMHFMLRTPVVQAVEGGREGGGGMRLADFFKEGDGGGGSGGGEEEEEVEEEGEEEGEGGRKRKRVGVGLLGAPRASAQQQDLVEPDEGEVDDKVLATLSTCSTTAAAAAAAAVVVDRRGSHRRRITANLAEDLVKLGKMAEELDVMEQGSGEIFEAYRRVFLKPLRATLAELHVDGLGEGGGGGGGEERGLMEEEEGGTEMMMTLNEDGDRGSGARGDFRQVRRGRGVCGGVGGGGAKRMRLV